MVKPINNFQQCIYDLYSYFIIGNDVMFDELQNAVKKLDQLCKSTKIVREYISNGEDIIDKVFSYTICDNIYYKLFLLDNVIFRALKIRYTSNSASYSQNYIFL